MIKQKLTNVSYLFLISLLLLSLWSCEEEDFEKDDFENSEYNNSNYEIKQISFTELESNLEETNFKKLSKTIIKNYEPINIQKSDIGNNVILISDLRNGSKTYTFPVSTTDGKVTNGVLRIISNTYLLLEIEYDVLRKDFFESSLETFARNSKHKVIKVGFADNIEVPKCGGQIGCGPTYTYEEDCDYYGDNELVGVPAGANVDWQDCQQVWVVTNYTCSYVPILEDCSDGGGGGTENPSDPGTGGGDGDGGEEIVIPEEDGISTIPMISLPEQTFLNNVDAEKWSNLTDNQKSEILTFLNENVDGSYYSEEALAFANVVIDESNEEDNEIEADFEEMIILKPDFINK
ncbi:MAG: hypothetical protein ABR595_08905 [Psychroflexus sp.]